MIAPWITADDLEDPSSPHADEAIESASYILWLLSARKFGGVRTTTETYCQMGLAEVGVDSLVRTPGLTGWQVWPYLREGVITNMVGGSCSSCGCPHLIRLRGGPVLSVQSVTVGGRMLASDEIAIYDYSLISAGKGCCWSSCEDVEVSYTFGAPPPMAGKVAAKELAEQFILAKTGDDACALPQRVTQISRQGMSWTLLDPQDFLDRGLTGIYSVDLFLRAVNPSRALLRARVFSPDIPRGKTKRVSAPTQMMATYGVGGGGSPSPMTFGGMTVMSSSPTPTPMASSMPTLMSASAPSSPGQVTVYEGQPLRWVVPGSFSLDNPPVVTVRPSGEEVPPDTLLWRTANYTLDLTTDQVAQLLPPGSVLVVSSRSDDDGSTLGQTTYKVERRTA